MYTEKGDAINKQHKGEILKPTTTSSNVPISAAGENLAEGNEVKGTEGNILQVANKFNNLKTTEPEEQEPALTTEDIEQIKKITFEIIAEVKNDNLNNAARILKNLSIDISSNINVSDVPIVEDKPYQKSVFHLLQEEGFVTEANAFGSYCKGLGYIDEFYYEF